MTQPASPKIKHVIMDWDGVAYGYNFLGTQVIFKKMAEMSLLKMAQIQFPDLSEREQKKLAKSDFEDVYLLKLVHSRLREDASEQEVIDCKQTAQALFHKNFYDMIEPHVDTMMAPMKALSGEFYKLQNMGVSFGVLSMGDHDEWMAKQIDHINIRKAFSYILDYYGVGYHAKYNSPKPVEQALEIAGVLPEEAVFIEDNLTNLLVAKAAFPGLTAIWIGSGKKPEGVDYMVKNLKGALKRVEKLAA